MVLARSVPSSTKTMVVHRQWVLVVWLAMYACTGTHFVNSKCISTRTTCQPPWLAHGDYCFLIVKTAMTFDDAESYCQSYSTPGRSAHLVSVANRNDSQFIGRYAAAAGANFRIWIGYTDAASEGNFIWTDGSTPGYDNWVPGEPDGQLNGEHCVKMFIDSGTIHDGHCWNNEQFVCKMPIG